MREHFEQWQAELTAFCCGKDRGEKPREVTGEPFAEDDADVFARLLGTEG